MRYKTRYVFEPDVLARNIYDAIHLGVGAYLRCNGDANCMTSELSEVMNYDGVSGVITIQSDGSAKKLTMFKIVKNGQFVPLPE